MKLLVSYLITSGLVIFFLPTIGFDRSTETIPSVFVFLGMVWAVIWYIKKQKESASYSDMDSDDFREVQHRQELRYQVYDAERDLDFYEKHGTKSQIDYAQDKLREKEWDLSDFENPNK